jgi:hypothetical protein
MVEQLSMIDILESLPFLDLSQSFVGRPEPFFEYRFE